MKPRRISPERQVRWWAGLVAAVCMAVTGQTDSLPHPWHHVVSVIGIALTAVSGYMLDRRR